GLDPDFAAANVGFFTGPYEERGRLGKPAIDRAARTVTITLPSGVRRTARHLGDQGCVTLLVGQDAPNFQTVKVQSKLPDAGTQPWPMGDVLPTDPLPAGVDAAKVKRAVDRAFEPAGGMTAAFVGTWKGGGVGRRRGGGGGGMAGAVGVKGRGGLRGERQGAAPPARTPLESWSMGK